MYPVRHTVVALALLCLFSACGGGGSEASPPTEAAVAADARANAFVQVEGCVVDLHDQPRATRVHAYSDDGRLIASASSSPEGVFQLRVPARHSVTVRLDTADPEALDLLIGDNNVSVTACLRESST